MAATFQALATEDIEGINIWIKAKIKGWTQSREVTLLVRAKYEARAEIIQMREAPHIMPLSLSFMMTSFVAQGGYKSMLRM